MAVILSIDPGVKGCGVALWADTILAEAWYSAGSMRDVGLDLPLCDSIAIEMPQAYSGRAAQKGDQNDLLRLATVVGYLIHHARQHTLILPRTWKGQVPKAVMRERVLSKLAAEERKGIVLPRGSLAHNVYDAIGVGLHLHGRL